MGTTTRDRASTGQHSPVRAVLPAVRVLLAVFSGLTLLAVVVLYGRPGATNEVFAWTIAPPLTAAFLGAGYAAGCVLVVLSRRDPVWAHTRIPFLTVLVFTPLTLAVTLMHLDRFHTDAPDVLPRVAAWLWLAVYVVVPLAVAAALVPQERAPGADPLPRAPVPAPLRAVLAVQSAVMLVVGAALFVDPGTASGLWAWPLTPLTARVVAAWLLAFGLATGLAAAAGDLARLRTATVSYTVFGLLELVALLRFRGTVDWSAPAA